MLKVSINDFTVFKLFFKKSIGKLYHQQKEQYIKDPRKLIVDSAGLTKSIGSRFNF